MSKLGVAKVKEFQRQYVEGLEDFIEIAVFDEDDLKELMHKIDLTDIELSDFKKMVVNEWPGIPSLLRVRLSDDTIINEVYAKIVDANPLMHPKNIFRIEAMNIEPELSDTDKRRIMLGFSSRNTTGTKVQVIQGNG